MTSLYYFIKDFPKTCLLILLLTLWGGHWAYRMGQKVPNAIDCAYQAWWLDGMTEDQWTFNWTGRNWSEQCKRKRLSDGVWIPYDRATDMGTDGEDEF